MRRKNNAFTLVELAIVIVIIGLLVGGVLQGQELIKQARLRHDVKRLHSIEALIATFYGKYNFLPGDMPGSYAARFFNIPASRGGDGDGKYTWRTNGDGAPDYFWGHLVAANLLTVVDENCSPVLKTTGNPYAQFKIDSCSKASSIMYAITNDMHRNQTYGLKLIVDNVIVIAGYNIDLSTASIGTYTSEQARSLDDKIDDGMALSGKFYGANSRNVNGEDVTCADSSGNYSNDESIPSCRILYKFGL